MISNDESVAFVIVTSDMWRRRMIEAMFSRNKILMMALQPDVRGSYEAVSRGEILIMNRPHVTIAIDPQLGSVFIQRYILHTKEVDIE